MKGLHLLDTKSFKNIFLTSHRSSTPLPIALTSRASSWTCPRSGRTAAAADPPCPSTRCGDSSRRWRGCSGRQGSRSFSCELSKRHLITKKPNWGRNSHFKKGPTYALNNTFDMYHGQFSCKNPAKGCKELILIIARFPPFPN